ncbi:MAG: hypothetical protein COW85_09950 [Ignavibacteria bacterium CG22_combo_CG10-13_8_21_14_all_37_15]|nr:MAG: hypothetical protein COW85_09950 [Ignavibacteria bacterium CG22_combo_CG10-13_8_21_14_all_37_15]
MKFEENMSSNKTKLFFLLRTIFGLVFILSGVLKLYDLSFFYSTILSFKIIPEQTAKIITFILPLVEIGLGVLLILAKKPVNYFVFSNVLLLFFSAILIAKLFEGEKINCSCFGKISNTPVDYLTILRNFFLILIGFYLEIHFHTSKLNIRSFLVERIKFYTFSFLIASLSLSSVILGAQNRGLKERLEILSSKSDFLKAGDTISSIKLLDAQKATIDFSFAKTGSALVFVYSNKCDPCRKNYINWETLIDSLKSYSSIEIIALCIDDFNSAKTNLQFIPPVKAYWSPSIKETAALKAFSTPQTLVIRNRKLKIDANIGILNSKKMENIFANVINTYN